LDVAERDAAENKRAGMKASYCFPFSRSSRMSVMALKITNAELRDAEG
jgi:hypothetical protein